MILSEAPNWRTKLWNKRSSQKSSSTQLGKSLCPWNQQHSKQVWWKGQHLIDWEHQRKPRVEWELAKTWGGGWYFYLGVDGHITNKETQTSHIADVEWPSRKMDTENCSKTECSPTGKAWAAACHPHPSFGSPTTEQVRPAYINQMLDVWTETAKGCKTQLPLLLVGLNSIYHARYRGITEREKYQSERYPMLSKCRMWNKIQDEETADWHEKWTVKG